MENVLLFVLLLQSKSRGQDLFDQIMYHIDLVETDYFGLQFMDTEQVSVSNKWQDFPSIRVQHKLINSCVYALFFLALAGHVQVYKERDPR